MTKKQFSKSNKHYDWAIIPDLYIGTALLLSDQLLTNSGIITAILSDGNILKNLGLRSAHPNSELVLPLVYNFKQGIELYLKTLGIIDYSTYEKWHDFKKLFEELKKLSKGTRNEQIIKKLYTDSWPIIKKYYYGRYIPANKKNNWPDAKNQAERYPEYPKAYKIPDRCEWVTGNVIIDIRNDIVKFLPYFEEAKRNIKPIKKFIYGKKTKKHAL